MAYGAIGGFPSQQMSFAKKEKQDWVGKCRSIGLEIKEVSDLHRKYDNHVFLVYMHVNKINGKVYVGITHHVNPNKRWGYNGQQYTHCTKFANAINKYGWNNFDHIILCRTNKERAIALEQVLIAHYKRIGMSYNLADGGEGSACITDETRRKASERMRSNHPMKGKHHTPEAKAKISEAGKRRVYTEKDFRQLDKAREMRWKNGIWKPPKKTIQKIKESLSRPVLQLDLNGNVIREFASTIEADTYINNGKRHNHIPDVCNGKRKTADGYRWVYKKDYELNKRGGEDEL